MPLQNYVEFTDGVPERMHFTSHVWEQITLADRLTGKPSMRNRLVMTVDEINGSKTDSHGLPIVARISCLAQGLVAKIEPYLAGDVYKNYDFIVTRTGTDYLTRYSVQVIPRAK